MTRPRRHRASGFTLVEVMVASAILVLMMAIAWGSVSQTIRAKKHFGAVQDRYREARVALGRMVRDLEMAYLSGNEDRSLTDPRTFFVGESSGEVDTLRFSSFAHTKLYADANESDQTAISYFAATDPDDPRRTNLIRRETRRLAAEALESIPGEADVLFSDIRSLELTYWDAREEDWRDTWSSQGEPAPRLPDRVRVTLTFLDEDGEPVVLTTQARIVLQEVIQHYAN